MIWSRDSSIATTTTVLSTKNAAMRRGTARRIRACSSPSVLSTRYRLPCIANIAMVVAPTSSANGLSSPMSVTDMLPSASKGTPDRMLPKATPSRRASPVEASANTMSQPERQRGDGSLLRNSMATVRRINTTAPA